MFVNRNLTNMPLKFILPFNIIIFEMIIPTNMISVTTFLKTISTFLNTLKMFIIIEKRYTDVIFSLIVLIQRSNYKYILITFTKLSNVTIVKNYLLMLVISEDT